MGFVQNAAESRPRRGVTERIGGLRAAAVLVLVTSLGSAESQDPRGILDAWLVRQTQVQSWSADVTQTRTLKAMSHPLVADGKVWFRQPNRFRWQLGDPPRTIAVRSGDELIVAYPQLARAERYSLQGSRVGAFKHALALLEVGLPVNRQEFDARYELVRVEALDQGAWRLILRPAAREARRLIDEIRFEVAAGDYTLLATELVFPDGSSMRNEFRSQRIDPDLDESLFAPPIEPDYDVVRPLESAR